MSIEKKQKIFKLVIADCWKDIVIEDCFDKMYYCWVQYSVM